MIYKKIIKRIMHNMRKKENRTFIYLFFLLKILSRNTLYAVYTNQ